MRLSDRLTILDPKIRDVIDSEEYRRYRSFENALDAFERTQTTFLMALHQNGRQSPGPPTVVVNTAADAAIAALQAQLWFERRPYAATIRERLENIKQAFWDEKRWSAVDKAQQVALKERSLKLM